MKTVAYLRVSRDTQDLNHQKLAILEFAQKADLKVSQFIELTISSRRSPKDRQLPMLLQQLSPSDLLIVSELSRLGRSTGEIITMVDTLVKRQIHLVAIKEGIHLSGEPDLSTKVMVTMFSLFAEMERELISLRTREALAAAKASGKRLGRPKGILGRSKLDAVKSEVQRLLALSVPKTSIAKIMGVDRGTLYHFIKSRGLTL
jgi:DNA invertase Pin-like site-specific DNA recombinase